MATPNPHPVTLDVPARPGADWSRDERSVLVALERACAKADADGLMPSIRGRLRAGRTTYGPLDVATDARCWRAEAIEEAIDLCVYLQCHALAEPGAAGQVDRACVAVLQAVRMAGR